LNGLEKGNKKNTYTMANGNLQGKKRIGIVGGSVPVKEGGTN